MQRIIEAQCTSAPRVASYKQLRKIVTPFENGEQLTQKEFHRRYERMPEDFRAELLGGVVHLSAALHKSHGQPLSLVDYFLRHYAMKTPGIDAYVDTTVILDEENEVQPDISLAILPEHGGRGDNSDRCFTQAPELVVEIANSSAQTDMNKKFAAYQKNDALEYLVHLVREPAVNWFVLKNGVYELLPCDKAGVIRSENFPGLWLYTRALLKRDLPGMIKTLELGLASPEHTAFCKRLRSAAAKIRARKTR